MSSFRLIALVAASFAIGAIVGAGSLWLVLDNAPEPPTAAADDGRPSVPVTKSPEPAQPPTYDPHMTTIEYSVRTDGMSVTHLSYVDVIDGAPVMVESLGSPPPFAYVIQLPKNEAFDISKLSVTGMGAATSTTTTCMLKVDGEIVARQSASGTYGLVNCSVSEGSNDA